MWVQLFIERVIDMFFLCVTAGHNVLLFLMVPYKINGNSPISTPIFSDHCFSHGRYLTRLLTKVSAARPRQFLCICLKIYAILTAPLLFSVYVK